MCRDIRHDDQFLIRPGCQLKKLLLPPLSFILLVVCGVLIVLAYKNRSVALSYAAKISGPHLIVDREKFWYFQLLEPIKYADVISVSKTLDQMGNTFSLTFECKTRPRLAFQNLPNRGTGLEPKYRFNASLFPNNDGLLDTVAFLVIKYQKEQNPDIVARS